MNMFYCEGCENEEQLNIKNEEAKKQQEQEEDNELEEEELSQTSTEPEQVEQPVVAAEQHTLNSISIQKRQIDGNNNRPKYSMSLPREIPDMLFKYAKKKSTNNTNSSSTKRPSGDARQTVEERRAAPVHTDTLLSVSFQNVTNPGLIEELKRDIEETSQRVEDQYRQNSQQSGDENRSSSLADEESDKVNEENNIGEAISYLASSIIAKDGRELFGYRPSRRVHINCISQSYF